MTVDDHLHQLSRFVAIEVGSVGHCCGVLGNSLGMPVKVIIDVGKYSWIIECTGALWRCGAVQMLLHVHGAKQYLASARTTSLLIDSRSAVIWLWQL